MSERKNGLTFGELQKRIDIALALLSFCEQQIGDENELTENAGWLYDSVCEEALRVRRLINEKGVKFVIKF